MLTSGARAAAVRHRSWPGPDRCFVAPTIYRSVNSLAVEMNYAGTWQDGKMGIPVFSMEDMYSGSHVLQNCMSQMGLIPTIAYDGNIYISNGIGNIDEEGKLLELPTRLSVRAAMKSIEVISKYAGLI